jgi:hypothetical protein
MKKFKFLAANTHQTVYRAENTKYCTVLSMDGLNHCSTKYLYTICCTYTVHCLNFNELGLTLAIGGAPVRNVGNAKVLINV